MAETVKPLAKRVYLCDDVVADKLTGKTSLLNIWDTVRLPRAQAFPFRLAKLCVFVWWRDGFGDVNTRVDIVQASTGKVLRRLKDCLLRFADRADSVFGRYLLVNCVFPEPGYYYAEVYCEGEFVDDQIFRVISD